MRSNIAMLAGLLAGLSAAQAATITTSDDVLFEVGTGANRATLVIDFNDGTSMDSFAWGYRWDGTGDVSGAQMILDVVAADPNLTITSFGDASAGFFLTSISYDDGMTIHVASNGDFSTPATSDFWSYNVAGGFAGDDTPGPGGSRTAVAGGGVNFPTSFTPSPVGASADSFGESGRFLSDGAWDQWSFVDSVPEPSALILACGGLGAFLVRRRR